MAVVLKRAGEYPATVCVYVAVVAQMVAWCLLVEEVHSPSSVLPSPLNLLCGSLGSLGQPSLLCWWRSGLSLTSFPVFEAIGLAPVSYASTIITMYDKIIQPWGGNQYLQYCDRKDHRRSHLFCGCDRLSMAPCSTSGHIRSRMDGWIDATSCVFEPLYGDSWKALAKVKYNDVEQSACCK